MRFGERGGWWVAAQFALFAGILFIGRLGLAGYRWDQAGQVGGALLLAGLAIAGFGAWQIRDSLTPYPQPIAGAELVRSGLYRWVRHPIYSGVILAFVGVALRQEDWLSLALGVLLVPFFILKATDEERRLMAAYPQYIDYANEVRHRLIPGVL